MKQHVLLNAAAGGVSIPTDDATTTHQQPPTENCNPTTPTLEAQLAEAKAQLATAEAQLKECGYWRKPNGDYALTYLASVAAWKINSYEFRDALHSGDESALKRLHNEIENALANLGYKFGIDGLEFALQLAEELEGDNFRAPVFELLFSFIENEAEGDAELKAADDSEAEELKKAEEEETPPSLVHGSGSASAAVRATGAVEPIDEEDESAGGGGQ